MGRIRTVKPELFQHDDLFDLEVETGLPIRLAFIGLFTVADREGRFKWKVRQLKLAVLPWDECDFSRVLDALASRGFLVKYEVDGNFYGCITNFTSHQVINNRESESNIPEPSNHKASMEGESSECNATGTCGSRVDDAKVTPLVHAQAEGKGREGKGKGKEKEYTREREVFEFWQAELNHPRAKLSDADRKKITARLKEFSVDELKLAIRGCKASPFHQGANEDGKIYDSIDLIFRNYQKTNDFMRMVSAVPQPKLTTVTAGNLQSAQQWLERKEH